MKRYVVVSSNNNPDYYFYLPYVEKAWASFGWDLCVMVTHDVDISKLDTRLDTTIIIKLPEIDELRDATVAQAGRLYAANYLPEDALIMTSDMDLIPMKDYWNPNVEDVTVYGHDLTDYTYFPMGYTAMSGASWKHYLNCTLDTKRDMLRDAQETEVAFSDDWEKWWNFDWDLLTKRLTHLKKLGGVTMIKRGRRLTGTYAYGRVDRGDSMKVPPNEELIDIHAENINVQHPDKLNKFLSIYESTHGKL